MSNVLHNIGVYLATDGAGIEAEWIKISGMVNPLERFDFTLVALSVLLLIVMCQALKGA